MRILISAYACAPGAGSEPGAGWAWVQAAAERHDVWLLTRRHWAHTIEAALEKKHNFRLHPVYLDPPSSIGRLVPGRLGVYWHYGLWQALAAVKGRRLHARVRFDVVHHLTYASDWMPAGVARVPHVPFVWGPVGGSTGTPWRLWRWLGYRGCISELVREVTTRLARRVFGQSLARRASLVVAQNADVVRSFPQAGAIVVEPNVAIEHVEVAEAHADARASGSGRRAVFAGRLLPLKGLRLAVAALARPEAADWTLEIYGSGQEARSVSALARRLGIAERIFLKGERPRAEVRATLATADALLFPSLHDSAPWVVAEALYSGCPVVCLDHGGPAILVGPGEGMKVAVDGEVVQDLADALASISGRIEPVDRWCADRLSARLAEWYAAVGSSTDPAPEVDTAAIPAPSTDRRH
jgi:glycosyltransferase involved in cell wall biosynthesis